MSSSIVSHAVSRSPRVELWDRLPRSRGAHFLGTGLVWRRARPVVSDLLQEVARSELRVYEVFAVRVAPGQASSRYPFTALLYQSAAFRSLASAHFKDSIVAKLMADIGATSEQQPLRRQVVLWEAEFVCLPLGAV